VPQTPNLAVTASASFPDSEVFGVKLVNNRPTRATFSFSNDEPEAVVLRYIGGHLATPEGPTGPSQVIRNLTATQYNVEIPAGEKETIQYSFINEMHPQDLRLNLMAVLVAGQAEKQALYTMQVYNETVSVVEAPMSWFDPQMYVLSLRP